MKKERPRNPAQKKTTSAQNISRRSTVAPKTKGRLSRSPRKTASKKIAPPIKANIRTSIPQPKLIDHPTLRDLPYSYNRTQIFLIPRDPYWAYTYWDFSGETWQWIENFRKRDSKARSVLRIHVIEESSSYDLDISFEAKNWYLDLGKPGTSFEVELGIIDGQGRFHSIARSNRIRLPRNGPSQKVDPMWDPGNFEEIYALSGGGRIGSSAGIFSSFNTTKKLSSS